MVSRQWLLLRGYIGATLGVAAATVVLALLRHHVQQGAVAALYLLVVVVSATRAGLGAAVWAALLSFTCWNFFFVVPYYTFYVAESQALLALLTFLAIAIITGRLAAGARQQTLEAQERERQTAALYELSLAVSSEAEGQRVLERLADRVVRVCGAAACYFYQSEDGQEFQLRAQVNRTGAEAPPLLLPPASEMARLSFDRGITVGMDEDRHLWQKAIETITTQRGLSSSPRFSANSLYLPLRAEEQAVGVMIVASDEEAPLTAAVERLVKTAANHAAVALQRERLVGQAAEALSQLETERLKASLLSSISHDLRTPLTSIKAAASSIVAEDAITDETERRALAQSIAHNADRLNNYVSNLLDISRLEAGAWQPSREPYPFIEIVGTVLGRLTDLEAACFEFDIPEDLPWVDVDEVQIHQVLWNLVENALKYAPPGSYLCLRATLRGNMLEVSLRDHGPGIPVGEEERIFAKFYRAVIGSEGNPAGIGIGLTICKEIVEAHGGKVWASNAPGGGAVFTFTLPLTEERQRS